VYAAVLTKPLSPGAVLIDAEASHESVTAIFRCQTQCVRNQIKIAYSASKRARHIMHVPLTIWYAFISIA
jgi:hypothetical protein